MKTPFLILILFVTILSADVREIKKSIPASKIHTVDLRGFNGSELEVTTWEKDEIAVVITIDYTSSKKERVQEYLKKLDLTENESNGRITLTYKDAMESDDGFSFMNFFNSLFSSYSNLKVSGTITLPSSCSFVSDMRYGKYSVDGVKGNLFLSGVANGLTVRNCASVQKIENDYGETMIDHCGGALELKGTSATITITDLNGSVKADADYSTITVSRVSGDVNLHCTSGELNIDNVVKTVRLDAQYSTITVLNTGGSVSIKSQSATIKVKQAANADINSLYSNITVESVTGTGEPVELVSQSGQIELSNISRSVNIEDSYSTARLNNILGNLTVDGNTTNIAGKKISGDLLVRNQYATIDIDDLTASSVEITNKSNAVRLDLLNKPTTIQINNEYGSVSISMPEFIGDVKLRAKYGSITTNLPIEVEDVGGSTIAFGKIGSGTGTMDVTTLSGNIDIRQRK